MVEGAGVFARGMIIKGRRMTKVRLLGKVVFCVLFFSATSSQYIDILSSKFTRPMVESAFAFSAPISMICRLVIIWSPIHKRKFLWHFGQNH